MPLGPGRSRSELVRCLRLCRVVSFLSYSPLCAFVLLFFCLFFCVLAGEKKHVGHHVVTIPLRLAPKLFVFNFGQVCAVVKCCRIS